MKLLKTSFCVMLCMIMIVSVCGCADSKNEVTNLSENIVAVVNGEAIYQNQIDMHISFNRMQIENLPQENKNEISALTEKEVLNDLIRKKVMLNYAKNIGISVDKKEAEKYIRESYEFGKEKNDDNFAFIMIVVCRNAGKRFDKPLFKWLLQN